QRRVFPLLARPFCARLSARVARRSRRANQRCNTMKAPAVVSTHERMGQDGGEGGTLDVSPSARGGARRPRRGRFILMGVLVSLAVIAAWYVVTQRRPAPSGAVATAATVVPPV